MGASSSQHFQIPGDQSWGGAGAHLDNSTTGKLRIDFLEFKDSLGHTRAPLSEDQLSTVSLKYATS